MIADVFGVFGGDVSLFLPLLNALLEFFQYMMLDG